MSARPSPVKRKGLSDAAPAFIHRVTRGGNMPDTMISFNEPQSVSSAELHRAQGGRSARKARTPRRRLFRPKFEPCWTAEVAADKAEEHLAPDSIGSVGFRVIAVALARTPEELIQGALAGDGKGAEATLDLLQEAEAEYKMRLELLEAARARILMSAAYAYGLPL